jgi:uncharacterized membrane protein
MRIEHHIVIDAPVSDVFALNIDVERWPSLTPTVTSVELLDGPLAVGARALIKQPGQRPTVWTVTELEPDHRFAWRARVIGVSMVATHVVEPTDGGCRNTLSLELHGAGGRLFGAVLGRNLRSVLATENEGFRRAAQQPVR